MDPLLEVLVPGSAAAAVLVACATCWRLGAWQRVAPATSEVEVLHQRVADLEGAVLLIRRLLEEHRHQLAEEIRPIRVALETLQQDVWGRGRRARP